MLSTRSKIAIAKVLHRLVRVGHLVTGRPMCGPFTRRGIRWQLDLSEGIDLMIYLAGAFEPSTVRAYEKLIAPGDVVFDIGANIGAHSLRFARLVGAQGRVHAFDPAQPAIDKLRVNCALNPELASRIVINHAFCTDRIGRTIPEAVYASWPLTGSAAGLHAAHLGRLHPVGSPRLEILDDYVERNRLPRVDFIKLDVDGSEVSVLRGARKILARDQPVILTEVALYIFKENGEDIREFWSIFRDQGYRMRLLNSRREIPLDSEYFAAHLPEHSSINVVLEHPNRAGGRRPA